MLEAHQPVADDDATASPTEMFFIATEQYVGHSATVVMEILLITSAFASTLAFHNTTSRYVFTLSREGLLPPVLSRVHGKHASPYLASGAQAAAQHARPAEPAGRAQPHDDAEAARSRARQGAHQYV